MCKVYNTEKLFAVCLLTEPRTKQDDPARLPFVVNSPILPNQPTAIIRTQTHPNNKGPTCLKVYHNSKYITTFKSDVSQKVTSPAFNNQRSAEP